MKTDPKLLTHPNIPKPMHGLNPRTVMGKDWWDKVRKEAYAKYDNHCYACGRHKSQDEYHDWLEAHEDYKINYKTGEVKLVNIVALCHSCHNFIHSGRLNILNKNGEVSDDKFTHIMKRGFGILKFNNLEPFYGTAEIWAEMHKYSKNYREMILRVNELKTKFIHDTGVSNSGNWSKWHLLIDGKKHYTNIKSARDWFNKYQK